MNEFRPVHIGRVLRKDSDQKGNQAMPPTDYDNPDPGLQPNAIPPGAEQQLAEIRYLSEQAVADLQSRIREAGRPLEK
jgi:hypothetical protein